MNCHKETFEKAEKAAWRRVKASMVGFTNDEVSLRRLHARVFKAGLRALVGMLENDWEYNYMCGAREFIDARSNANQEGGT